jgi:superfamily II DNA or RNA helicase
LIKEENAYIKKITGNFPDEKKASYHIVHIAASSIPEALKLFATTGKLYFNDKQLVIDLYGKAAFHYAVDSQSVEGLITSGAQEFPIHTCDFIGRGPPHWFIKGISLKCISTEVSWKDLKSAYQQETFDIDELITDAKEDPTAPRVSISNAYAPIQSDPLPVLMLTDRNGAFANLMMDYNNGTPLVDIHDPDVKSCKRSLSAEQAWEKDLLETDFIAKFAGNSHYYCPLDKVAKSIGFLLEIGWTVRDWKGNRVLLQNQIDLQAQTQSKGIFIKGKVHYDTFEANLTDIVGAFNRRERFAEIAPGHVALLPNSWDQSGLDAIVEEGEIVGDAFVVKKNSFGMLSGLFESQPKMAIDTPLAELKSKLDGFSGIQSVAPGKSFTGTLRPYQQEGLNWLSFLHDFGFSGMLADDMGLGKTVQVLAFISTLSLEKPLLIVVPTSLIFNWKKEIERFLPDYMVSIHHGPKRSQSVEVFGPEKHQLILTTYTTLRLDFALFSQISFSCLIIDEAQAIKNANTQTSQAITRIQAPFRLSITGTPVENNLQELWSHFHFLIPDLFGNEESFAAEIQAGMSDQRYLKRIKRKIRPFLLRRRKEEVAKDLPEKIEQTVWVEMSEKQRALYEEFLSGIRRNVLSKVSVDGAGKHRMEILEAIMRLRQICCHPLLVSAEGMSESTESAKLEALMQDLETAIAEGRKVLVYSQFTSMLALIGKHVKLRGWQYVYLDGSTQNREKVVTEFQENSSIPLFLISLKAGGIGLNLTAADYVFLYDPWWNNAVENQAIDRAHRIGRKDTVIAKRYVVAESIEEKMMKLKAAKSSLAAELLDDDSVPTQLSTEDLLFLLS